MNDRTPETAFDRGVTFDGFVHGKVSDQVVSVYKYSVCVNAHPAFGTDVAVSPARRTTPLAFAMAVGFKSRLLDKPAALTRTGTAMAAMKTERNEIGRVFISGYCSSPADQSSRELRQQSD